MIPIRPNVADLPPYAAGKKEPGKLKLASNENPLGPSPRAIEAARLHLESMQLYPDGASGQLTAALARHHQLPENWFIAGNGSDEVLMMAAATFLCPGDEVVIADHTFSEYRTVSRIFEAAVKAVPLERGAWNMNAVQAAMGPKTRIVFLCSPNNPTGTIIPGRALEAFLERVPPQVLVVLDEAYAEFMDSPEAVDSRQLVRRHANLLVTRTFSKLYGLAGFRVGYGYGQPELVGAIQRVRPPFNVNTAGQSAAAAALDDNEFIKKSLKGNREGRDWLTAEIGKLGLACLPSQANFICIETRRDAQAMYRAIASGGVTIRALTSFGLPTCIRVTVGTETQNRLFIGALSAALAAVPAADSLEGYLA
jgi:histidinol-phosphate aminotransferase